MSMVWFYDHRATYRETSIVNVSSYPGKVPVIPRLPVQIFVSIGHAILDLPNIEGSAGLTATVSVVTRSEIRDTVVLASLYTR